VHVLLAEVTQAWETTAAAEAARAAAMLAADTSTREALAARDSVTLCVKDVEERATLAERETLERVLRVEAEKATALASTHEDAEGLARKITLLKDELAVEHRAREVSKREHHE
jgi:hypothetical protein